MCHIVKCKKRRPSICHCVRKSRKCSGLRFVQKCMECNEECSMSVFWKGFGSECSLRQVQDVTESRYGNEVVAPCQCTL